MDKVIENKRGLELVPSCSSGYEASSEKFLYLLVIPCLTKFDIKRLLSYFKNCILKFMQTSSWHHKLFHFHLSFFIWRVWKEWGKLQKFEYLEKEKSFFDEIRHFS